MFIEYKNNNIIFNDVIFYNVIIMLGKKENPTVQKNNEQKPGNKIEEKETETENRTESQKSAKEKKNIIKEIFLLNEEKKKIEKDVKNFKKKNQ